ncbi:class I SAM-dependent methyltransferase [Halomonas campisalis]|uniref:Class I SAM-dependent methyltransferase n=1 Tax=Billgrantia campisalis TaxID=74661 RepID=A0ABS9P8B5_9GAMM|nr:class I SAM-dependent methyltransferase [Halomonas campisalis]MCG6658021.1 class I SAM-dependent methyltransferase [Halomonas campisalis]MDR5864855.1 class I SAM-dependent methyltransferase [Halomonas campisalis]
MTGTMPDIQTIKDGMRKTWMAGDFGEVAKFIQHHADDFIANRHITPGLRLLDVACGTGNLAIPAARAGASVTGIDIADNLIEQARSRARAEGLDIRFEVGDAENLALPDASFDAVVSMYGAMFAPRPEYAAAELVRVCRPGGTIAMANWMPETFIGEMFKVVGRHAPPPEGVPSPALWGDPATVRERLREGITELRTSPVTVIFEYPFSVPEVVEFHRQFFGPIERAWARLEDDGREALRQDLEAHWSRHNEATDGSTRVEAQYLEVVATRATS